MDELAEHHFGSNPDHLRHRGPDYMGRYRDKRIYIEHCKLSILDETFLSHQPIIFGRWIIAFNGEIYNFRSLAVDLGLDDLVFDGDVIGPGFAKYGERFWSHLDGEFAIIVYDTCDHSLILVRDRFGAKPLFIARERGVWHFASEIKGIRLPRVLNTERACLDLLYGPWSARGSSWFDGVSSVPPGHFLHVNNASAHFLPYWSMEDNIPESSEPLEIALTRSIKSRLSESRPVALLLSGGVDSSLVAAVAASGGHRPTAYTVRFPDAGYLDESEEALLTAATTGLELRYVDVEDSTLIATWDSVTTALEEPPIDAAYIAVWSLYKAIHADGFRVALTGQGNDELWLGYQNEAGIVFKAIGRTWSQIYGRFARERVLGVSSGVGRSFWSGSLFNSFISEEKDLAALQSLQNSIDGKSPALAAVQLGMLTILGRNLDQEDRISMAHSIESRLPLLSNSLLTHATKCAALRAWPLSGREKFEFRKAAEFSLKRRVAHHDIKQSFPVPTVLFQKVCKDYVLGNWQQIRTQPPIGGFVNENIGVDDCKYVLDRNPRLAVHLFGLHRFSACWL